MKAIKEYKEMQLGDVKDTSTTNHIVQQRRQNDVRSMINSKKWKELEIA